MIEQLIKFLIDRKALMLQYERVAKGKAKISMSGQIQVIDSILVFLSQNKNAKGDINMESLKLSLDKTNELSIEEIKARQNRRSGSTLTKAIIELVAALPEGKGRIINGTGVNKKTVAATVSRLTKRGVLPKNIAVMTAQSGKETYIVKMEK